MLSCLVPSARFRRLERRCDLVWSGDGDDMSNYQVVPNFRVRTIPVLGPIPAVFGMACAAYVLTQLAEQPFHSDPIIPLKVSQAKAAMAQLANHGFADMNAINEIGRRGQGRNQVSAACRSRRGVAVVVVQIYLEQQLST